MTTGEIISNMARLSLVGELNLAILEYSSFGQWCFALVPYYKWDPQISIGEFLTQISLQSFASQYGTLLERELSILLGISQEICLS